MVQGTIFDYSTSLWHLSTKLYVFVNKITYKRNRSRSNHMHYRRERIGCPYSDVKRNSLTQKRTPTTARVVGIRPYGVTAKGSAGHGFLLRGSSRVAGDEVGAERKTALTLLYHPQRKTPTDRSVGVWCYLVDSDLAKISRCRRQPEPHRRRWSEHRRSPRRSREQR